MASVSNVTLHIEQTSLAECTVTVNSTLTFTAAETDQQYMLLFRLFSSDPSGDDEGAKPSKPLVDLTFLHMSSVNPDMGIYLPYKRIKAVAGTNIDTSVCKVASALLNEDPGFDLHSFPGHIPSVLPFTTPKSDEISVRVYLFVSQSQSKPEVVYV